MIFMLVIIAAAPVLQVHHDLWFAVYCCLVLLARVVALKSERLTTAFVLMLSLILCNKKFHIV